MLDIGISGRNMQIYPDSMVDFLVANGDVLPAKVGIQLGFTVPYVFCVFRRFYENLMKHMNIC